MKTRLLINIIYIILPTILPIQVKSQNTASLSLEDQSLTSLELPSLDILFQNATSSATVKYYDARKESEKSMLSTVKNQWLKYFKIVGAYQYGVMGTSGWLSDSNLSENASNYHLSSSRQNWYNVGFAISVPLDELFDRRNKIRRQKMEMKATEAEVERWYDEQKIRIIEIYTRAQSNLNQLKTKAEAMVLAKAQYSVAELDFTNGIIKPADLSARKSVETDAIVNYEQTKWELIKSLLELEILSKTEILH